MPDASVAERIQEVMELLACGCSLRRACLDAGIDRRVFERNVAKSEALRDAYVAAKQTGILMELERARDLHDELDERLQRDDLDPKTKAAMVMKVRFEVDFIRWELCKLVPRMFGEAVEPPAPSPTGLIMDLTADTDE